MSWETALARRLGGPVRVLHRRPLAGGHVARSVERVDLDVDGRELAVVLKTTDAAETAAMRAVAVVPDFGRGAALVIGRNWVVLPYVDGPALAPDEPVPDVIWEQLARVHVHWWRRRPRGIPVVDGRWWRGLVDHTLGVVDRADDPALGFAVDALRSWRDAPAVHGALAVLPRTLTHSDPHRGNILVDTDGPVLIDWGNARVAPAGVDVAVPGGSADAYERKLAQLGSPIARLPAVEEPWARLHVTVHYLGYAVEHLGVDRVREMVDAATAAHTDLGRALYGHQPG